MKKTILLLFLLTGLLTTFSCKKNSDPSPSSNQTPATVKPVTSSTYTKSGLIVTFSNTSTNTPTSYSWNFGDGTAVSTDKNPVHTYSAAGTYTVVLTATNAGGSTTQSQSITVAELKPAVASSTYTKKGLTVTFTNTSTNTPTSYSWNFGDGTALSTEINPMHSYSKNGTYTITLTATNSDGSSTQTQSVTVAQLNCRILKVTLLKSLTVDPWTGQPYVKAGTDPNFFFSTDGSIIYTSAVAYKIPYASLPYTWTLPTPFEIPASKFATGFFLHMMEYVDQYNYTDLFSDGYVLSTYPTYPSKIRLDISDPSTELTVEWYE